MEAKPTKEVSPKNGEPIIDRGAWYEIPGYKGLYAYKEMFGRKMSPKDYVSILKGEKQLFEGFISTKKNTKYSAFLELDPATNRFKLAFPEKAQAKTLSLTCPLSKEPVLEYPERFVFPGFKKADGRLVWFAKEISSRKMSAEDYLEILTKSSLETPLMFDGFISKKNKPYSAGLYFSEEEGWVKLVFPDREGGSPAPAVTTKRPARAETTLAEDEVAGGNFLAEDEA